MSKRNPSKLKGKQNARKVEMQKRSRIVSNNVAHRTLKLALDNIPNLVAIHHPAKRDCKFQIWAMPDNQDKEFIGWGDTPTEITYVKTNHGFKPVNHKLNLPMVVLEK